MSVVPARADLNFPFRRSGAAQQNSRSNHIFQEALLWSLLKQQNLKAVKGIKKVLTLHSALQQPSSLEFLFLQFLAPRSEKGVLFLGSCDAFFKICIPLLEFAFDQWL